jgi:polyisoprenyl-phosphate glycosyltransferase
VRGDDPRLSLFKRLSSALFYRLLNSLSDIRLEKGAADFRLLDRSVADVLRGMSEYYLFFRGLTAWVGFRQCAVPYQPEERLSGRSKYSLKRMAGLALAGITSFSLKPLRFSVLLGGLFACGSFAYGLYAVLLKLFSDRAVPGWSSILASILFIGGVQLIVLGIIGEYIGQLVMESKHRPRYIVREKSIAGAVGLDGPRN